MPHAMILRPSSAVLLLLGAFACAPGAPSRGEPTPDEIAARYRHDDSLNQHFVPNPDFIPQLPDVAVQRSSLSLEGEVLIIEGDAETVAVGGPDAFGITDANQVAIVQQVLAAYPDEFDTIQIYTTFIDQAHQGIAYYQGIKNDVAGIGTSGFNGRGNWGLDPDNGRLSGFSNMNSMLMWGNGSFNGLNTVEGYYHGVIAHELSHRWLFRMQFTDPSGNPNESLLGRDNAHWSRLAHAYGSVHDGNFFVDNGNNTFTNMGTDMGFSPLELYAMGRIPALGVEPFFYLTEATLMGAPLDKLSNIGRGDVVAGTRINVEVSQVVDQMGPRNPPYGFDNPYYRAAMVLVTAPGEARASWEPHLTKLKEVQADFPQTWRNWTGGGMCTQVTERCPEPVLGLADYKVEDGGDNIAAPGEQVQVRLSAQNTGLGLAEGATVELVAVSPGVQVNTSAALTVPPVEAGSFAALTETFAITVAADLACAEAIQLQAIFHTKEGPVFSEVFSLTVGTRVVKSDPLNEAPDWTVDPDGTDTALQGQWDLGEPGLVTVLGLVTQPGEDHTPGEGKLSFHTGVEGTSFFADNDLDGGTTTLESPVFSLTDSVDPILSFFAWRMAGDFTVAGGPGPVPGSQLKILASNDGGETYVEMGELSENTEAWTRVAYRIRDTVEPSPRMRFRFVIADPSMVGNVEAGVDDLEILDFVAGCEIDIVDPKPTPTPTPTPKDEGCTSTSGSSSAALLLLGLALLAGRARRRR